MSADITVCIPAYNAERWIDAAIASVRRQQQCPNIVLLIIDDGSQDQTLAKIRHHAQQDQRIQIYADGQQRGLVARLNQSIELCQTPFYARMDADDVMHPQRLQRQWVALQTHPHYAFCVSSACVIDEYDRLLGVRRAQQPSAAIALSRGSCVHPTLLARTTFLQANPYLAHYARAEDRELFLRDNNWQKGLYLDEALLFYRVVSDRSRAALRLGYASERRILAQYGPSLVGQGWTRWMILRSWLKSAYVILRGSGVSGLQRGLQCDDAELACLSEALSIAQSEDKTIHR